jgi:hypothetical protein
LGQSAFLAALDRASCCPSFKPELTYTISPEGWDAAGQLVSALN